MRGHATLHTAWLLLAAMSGWSQADELGTLRLSVFEGEGADPLPCRVQVMPAGERAPVRLEICDGRYETALPPGEYRLVVERGPEYARHEADVTVAQGETTELTIRMGRVANLAEQGWWSGDLHVHLSLDDAARHMLAEDVHIVPLIQYWNKAVKFEAGTEPGDPVRQVAPNRFCYTRAQEHEPLEPVANGNSVIYSGLSAPLEVDGNMAEGLRRAKEQGAWADIEKPYIWDLPVLLATGQVDSIGIAVNTLVWWLRDGFTTYEELGFGRPRDLSAYPGLHGIGLYIQDLYYKVLNCGFRIPPSAGTAVGVRWVPVGMGFNRVYVKLDGPLDYARWWEGLAAGRVFVTNGPLLDVKANGALPGEVLKTPEGEAFSADLAVFVVGNDAIERVELILNGKVVQSRVGEDLRGEVRLDPVSLDRSGWFLVRAIARTPVDNFRFASTGPFYVEVGGQPQPVDAEAVAFFQAWIDERMDHIRRHADSPETAEYLLRPFEEAKAYFERL